MRKTDNLIPTIAKLLNLYFCEPFKIVDNSVPFQIDLSLEPQMKGSVKYRVSFMLQGCAGNERTIN